DPQADAPASAVTVTLSHVPAGGNLLVEVSVPSDSLAASTAVTDPSPPDWELPVVVDVQRQDEGVSSGPISTSPGGDGAIGGLPQGGRVFVTPSAAPSLAAPSPWTQRLADPQTVANQSQEIASLDESADSPEEPGEFWAIRVATGPLAARSAAPLGP